MGNLKKNITYNFIYQFLILFLPFVTAPYLSRVIDASGVGTYSYSYSIALSFTYITMLGLNNYGNRSIAAVQDNYELRSQTFCEIQVMQTITFALSATVYAIYALFFAQDRIVALIQGIFVLSSLLDINWFFFGMEQFRITVIRNTIIKIVTVICVFVFVRKSSDIYKYILIMALGNLLSQICLWFFVRKFVAFRRVGIRDVLKHFKPNLMLFIPVIAVSIYKIMDKVMLGAMSSMDQLGYFENAEKIINVPVALFTAIGTVMLPRMTSLISSNRVQESRKYIDKTMLFALLFANGAMLGIMAVAKEFSVIYYGSDFIRSGEIMCYLAITIVFLACGNVIRTQYLIPNKKDKIYIMSAILGAIVNFIINYMLIPKFAAMGACIGTIVAEFTVCFYQLFSVRKEFVYLTYVKDELVFLIDALIMYVVIKVMPDFSNVYLTLITHVCVGGLVYVSLAGIYLVRVKKVVIKRSISVIN